MQRLHQDDLVGQILLKVRRSVLWVKAKNVVYLVRPIDTQILGRVDPAFNKKRLGKMDLAILVRLQSLVEIFGLRWMSCLSQNTTRVLRESDIGDLLEAGTYALGMPDCSALTDAESIGRALERFRQRKSNSRTCLLLRRNAEEICDGFRLRPLAPKIGQNAWPA